MNLSEHEQLVGRVAVGVVRWEGGSDQSLGLELDPCRRYTHLQTQFDSLCIERIHDFNMF